MEGLIVDTGKTLVERLINNAIERSRYIVCFTCISNEFDEEKIKLEAEMTTMRQRFKVATNKGKEIMNNADLWEKQANKLIQEETKTKQRCFFGFFPDCIERYKRGRDLTTKIEEVKKLVEKGEKLENVELARSLPDIERYSSQYYISFESREIKIKELLDALKDGSHYIIGLYGMGGTGKTTLTKEVGKQVKTFEQFDHVIDTTVSFTPDIKKIQNDIAGSLGLEWGDINESDRPKMLWRRLTNGEKILVILDDVWEFLNFDEIGIPKSDNHNGCKVLVTTRNLRVCNRMICGITIKLELLSKEDAWVMFKMHAHLDKDSSKSFHEKGYKITTECKRLPVAIATIASSLKGQTRLEEWDYALKSLQKHLPMGDVDDDLVDIYKCLKFSYDYLKNEKAKRLFLLCSVFPEDEEISIEILTRLSTGVDLFGEDYGSYEDARSQIVEAKNKLLYSCLLLETQGGKVKMHDLVREVAQWIANKEIQTVSLSNKIQKSLVERDKNIKYLLCEGNPRDFFSSMFDGSKLEILIFIMDICESVDVPISFFENIPGLRVLSLSNKDDGWLAIERTTLSLSQSIQSLMNIRSLLVKNINLGDISILGSLKSLETLDLTCCYIDELPHEIINLEKFQLLNLDTCRIRRNNPFEVIQRCSSLEELYFCYSFNDFCQKITLPTLQRYCLIDDFRLMNNSLSKYVSLEHNYFSEATFKYLIQTTEFLQLKIIEKEWRNIMPEVVPIYQGMNDIIELHLIYDSELQYLVDTKQHIDSQVPNVFSKLVVLELYEMGNLEELCNGPISFDSMSHLQELTIEYCWNLRNLFKGNLNLSNLKTVTINFCSTLVSIFDLPTSQSLLLLEKLNIINCEQLENIFTHDDDDDDDGNNKSCNSMFPKLKVVNIQRCEKLRFIFPLLSTEDLLLLETVKIDCCDELKYIFGQHQNVELASLKELELECVPNFIGIFPESHNSIEGSSNSISKPQTQLQVKLKPIKSNIFSLSQLCCYTNKLRGTHNTKIPLLNCSVSMVPNLNCFSSSICNIKVIKLMFITKIKSVFMLSIAPKMSLESLTIRSCNDLEHIIVDNGDGSDRNELGKVFPNLKELHVEDCEKLKYIFGHINDSDDHQNYNNEVIQLHLPALECLELRQLPSLIGMCTKHYQTTFPSLMKVDLGYLDVTKSIGDLIVPKHSMISISQEISTTFKELSVNIESIDLGLEILNLKHSNVQNIFCLNVVNEQQMNLGFKHIELEDLPMMTSLFVGPKHSFALQFLRRLKIIGCEKLKIIFSTSIIRCLPQLYYLKIKKCDELTHIIEDDTENKQMSNCVSSKTCFPKLRALVVIECNKLKSVFPKTKALVIKEANEIQEEFGTEGDQKVESPNLEFVAFINLSSLFHVQGTQFQAVPNCFVQNCQNVSLTSTLSSNNAHNLIISLDDASDYDSQWKQIFQKLQETTKDFVAENEIEVQATSGHMLTSSQELLNEPSTSYLGDIDTAVKHSQGTKISDEDVDIVDFQETTQTNKGKFRCGNKHCDEKNGLASYEGLMSKQSMDEHSLMNPQQSIAEINTNVKHSHQLEVSTSENSAVTTLSTISRTENELPIQLVSPKQKSVEINVKEETTSANAKTISSSSHIEFVDTSSGPLVTSISQEDGDDQIATTSISIATAKTNDQDSLSNDIAMKVSSNVEKHSPREDEIIVSKSRSPFVVSQYPSQLFEDFDLYLHMESIYQQFQENSKGRINENENSNAHTTKEFTAWIEAQATSRHELTSSQIKLNQTPEEKREFDENVPALEIPPVAILPTNSEGLMSNQSIDEYSLMNPQQSVVEINTNTNVIHSQSQQINLEVSTSETTLSIISGAENEEDGDDQIATTLFSIATTMTNDQDSLSGDIAMKVSPIIVEQQSRKEDKIIVSKSRPSSSVSQCPSKPFEGDPSQKVEDLSSSLLISRELEQLVSKNHLDYKDFSLLTEFLVKHPFVILKDTSLGNRYKGHAYNLLADLLKFLKTHSVLEVLGSCQTEFVELLEDARRYAFDKDWLDDVERRALFLEIPVSQDALHKLLDSKQQVTKDVEVLRLTIDILNQNAEKLKHQLTSSEMLLESIIQQEALLSSPIGY